MDVSKNTLGDIDLKKKGGGGLERADPGGIQINDFFIARLRSQKFAKGTKNVSIMKTGSLLLRIKMISN